MLPHRKLINTAVAAALVVVFYGRGCYRDVLDPYRWDAVPRGEAQETGWELAVEHKAGDVVFPWTWFNPPTVSMAFVRPGSLYRRTPTSDTVFAPVMQVRREESGKVIQELELQAFDCNGQRFTLVADLSQVSDDVNLNHLTTKPLAGPWGEMSTKMIKYFCSS